jgi:deoxyribose-phosphate aldolase
MEKQKIQEIINNVRVEIDRVSIKNHPSKAWIEGENARRERCGSIEAPGDIAPLIDHTLLKPDATRKQIFALCDEADENGFASVCINPYWVPVAAERLSKSSVLVCTVIGFPLGATLSLSKGYEANIAAIAGADELDMVINIGQLKAHKWVAVFDDILSVVEAVESKPVKVILETSLLTEEEIVAGSAISELAGASYVKTSTGFAGGGATVESVSLMASTVGKRLGVKASGGVGNFDSAIEMIRAGATRIGASRSIQIISG